MGQPPSLLSGCAITRVYVRGAADGWIFLRSYLDFSYVSTGFDESIYDTSIIEVVDIPCRNPPYYVAYMLLPVCAQFRYANRDLRMQIFYRSPPVCIRRSPYAYGDPRMYNFAYRNTRLDFPYGNSSCMHTVSD
jgi:hypothetical protein